MRGLLMVLGVLGAGVAAGCAGGLTVVDDGATPSVVLAESVPVRGAPSDRASIAGASLQGDVLVLDVRFGGGCADHAFDLYAQTAFMESEPVQTRLALAHQANGDACRALLSRELRFDLAPLRDAYRRAYGPAGRIVLHVQEPGASGAQHDILYTF
jgi:hypothetical protein